MGESTRLCPSAQPHVPGAAIHGVVDAATGRIVYLETRVPVTPELLASTFPMLPTQIVRVSAPCQEGACAHFADSACTLGERLVSILPASEQTLTRCAIRVSCRWFHERGKAACLRCELIITDEYTRNIALDSIAAPPLAR